MGPDTNLQTLEDCAIFMGKMHRWASDASASAIYRAIGTGAGMWTGPGRGLSGCYGVRWVAPMLGCDD
jgi:hypothetical protein